VDTTTRFVANVPFGRDVASQEIKIQPNYNGTGGSWYVVVLVGELYTGDELYDPEKGSQIVKACIYTSDFDHAEVTEHIQRSQAYTVDGYPGWITEANLSFSIPGLITTSELAILIIVKTSATTSSIFYAIIPNNAQQYAPDVQSAINNLHVVT